VDSRLLSALKVSAWAVGAGAALIGCYVGLFTVLFSLAYQDIDGPVPLRGRLIGSAIGLGIFLVSALLARVLYTQRKKWRARRSCMLEAPN
jgi:hypothetical protein